MNYMDNRIFISIREGVTFYYFGSGCIADYYGESIAYLDDTDVFLINLCDGSSTLSKCINQMKGVSDENVTRERIERMRRKGVLVIKEYPSNNRALFYGEKGFFYPKQLAIELTSCCNYNCSFCYKDAKAFGKYISDDIVDNIVNIIDGKVGLVTFTGGEPTLHPHIINYIEQFSKKTPYLTMITNGSLLYKFAQYASTLQKLDNIQFSIYGRNDDEYEKTTGNRNGFTHLKKSIEFAQKNNIKINLSLTLSTQTIHFIEEFVEAAKTLDVEELKIGFADNYGRGKNGYNDEFVQKQKEAMKTIDNLRRINKGKIKIRDAYMAKLHGYKRDDDDLLKYVYRGAFPCGAGTEDLVISSEGKIRPCHYMPENIFSIPSENALYEHINGDFHVDYLQKAIAQYIDMRKNDNYELCRGMCSVE